MRGDSWYSCVSNLKPIKNHQLGLLFALESNRLVSVEKGAWVQVQQLDIPEHGLVVWLKKFGRGKVFRTQLKDQRRHYICSLPNEDRLSVFDRNAFSEQHDRHWQIEQYHRAIKQVCNIEHFQVRSKGVIKNHLFAAICGYVQLQKLTALALISNGYSLQRNLFNEVMRHLLAILCPAWRI